MYIVFIVIIAIRIAVFAFAGFLGPYFVFLEQNTSITSVGFIISVEKGSFVAGSSSDIVLAVRHC